MKFSYTFRQFVSQKNFIAKLGISLCELKTDKIRFTSVNLVLFYRALLALHEINDCSEIVIHLNKYNIQNDLIESFKELSLKTHKLEDLELEQLRKEQYQIRKDSVQNDLIKSFKEISLKTREIKGLELEDFNSSAREKRDLELEERKTRERKIRERETREREKRERETREREIAGLELEDFNSSAREKRDHELEERETRERETRERETRERETRERETRERETRERVLITKRLRDKLTSTVRSQKQIAYLQLLDQERQKQIRDQEQADIKELSLERQKIAEKLSQQITRTRTTQALEAERVLKERQALEAERVLKERQALEAERERQALEAERERQALEAERERQALEAERERQALEAERVLKERQALEAERVLKERQALEAERVLKERQALEADRVLKEQAQQVVELEQNRLKEQALKARQVVELEQNRLKVISEERARQLLDSKKWGTGNFILDDNVFVWNQSKMNDDNLDSIFIETVSEFIKSKNKKLNPSDWFESSPIVPNLKKCDNSKLSKLRDILQGGSDNIQLELPECIFNVDGIKEWAEYILDSPEEKYDRLEPVPVTLTLVGGAPWGMLGSADYASKWNAEINKIFEYFPEPKGDLLDSFIIGGIGYVTGLHQAEIYPTISDFIKEKYFNLDEWFMHHGITGERRNFLEAEMIRIKDIIRRGGKDIIYVPYEFINRRDYIIAKEQNVARKNQLMLKIKRKAHDTLLRINAKNDVLV
jgi:hypothetical protein